VEDTFSKFLLGSLAHLFPVLFVEDHRWVLLRLLAGFHILPELDALMRSFFPISQLGLSQIVML